MGKKNRRRRADKKRQGRRSGPGGGAHAQASGWGRFDSRAMIEALVHEGAEAAFHGPADRLDAAVASLVELARAHGAGAVTSAVSDATSQGLAEAWEGGWQPTEVVRQVRRRCRSGPADLLTSALASTRCWQEAGGAPMPAAWSNQLDELGTAPDRVRPGDWVAATGAGGASLADLLRGVLAALGELAHLERIEALSPKPSQWASSTVAGRAVRGDDPVLSKVRALLAKAESTSFAAEAEALTTKAQELMARYAIDAALARATDERADAPITRRLAVDDPYAEAKAVLLQVIVDANRARCVWYDTYAMMAVVGFTEDVEAIEVLFTSLLVQAGNAMMAKGSVTDRAGRSRTRSFRQSFLLAFASRIGERLELAARQARQEAEATTAGLLPVLAAKDRDVDDAVRQLFPRLRTGSGPAATNDAGWRAGRVAAELATLGPQQGVLEEVFAERAG